MTFKKNSFILWGILILAGIFRLYQPGLLPTWVDELNTMDAALRLARHGEWTWVGNTTSFAGISVHSPFSVYVTALPALFFPNPLAMRLFYGLLGLLLIVLVYKLMTDYVGQIAAIFSALFLAVMPLPVYWSRFVWNPNIAPIFIVIWLFSALGYFKNDWRFQVIHYISLSFIVQSQTSLLILIPASLALTIYGAWSARQELRSYVLTHFAILLVVIITLIPWFYGLYGISKAWFHPTYGFGKVGGEQIILTFPNLQQVWYNFCLLTASVGYQRGTLKISGGSTAWWTPDWLYSIMYLQTLIILAGGIAFILQGVRTRKLNTWHVFIALMLFYPLGIHIVKRPISDFYLMPIAYVGIVILGMSFEYMLRKTRLTIIIVTLLFIAQTWLSISVLIRFYNNPNTLSYGEIVQMLDTWSNHGQRDVLVIEDNPDMVKLEQHDWITNWDILSNSYPVRYLSDSSALPIDSNGEILVRDRTDLWVETLIQKREIFENHQRRFIASYITFDNLPVANFIADNDQFGNLIHMLGVTAEKTPQASEVWDLYVLWEPQTSLSEQYQFSVRLQANDGQRYGQIDGTTLAPELWRVGERVITRMRMPVSDLLPANAQTHLEIVLYRLLDGQTVPVLDSKSNPIRDYMTLVLNSN